MKRVLVMILAAAIVMIGIGSAVAITFDKATIKSVQQALNDAGFECGKPDGSAGKKTKAAVSAWREANGLEASEEIDVELIHAMGIMDWADLLNNNLKEQGEVLEAMRKAAENGDAEAIELLEMIAEVREAAEAETGDPEADLIGVWHSEWQYNGNDWTCEFTINEDHTCTAVYTRNGNDDGTQSGPWHLEGDRIIWKDEASGVEYIFEIDGAVLNGGNMEFTKK